jgi:hypothetical protein
MSRSNERSEKFWYDTVSEMFLSRKKYDFIELHVYLNLLK